MDTLSSLLEEFLHGVFAATHIHFSSLCCECLRKQFIEPLQPLLSTFDVLTLCDQPLVNALSNTANDKNPIVLRSHVGFEHLQAEDVVGDFSWPISDASSFSHPLGFNREVNLLFLWPEPD